MAAGHQRSLSDLGPGMLIDCLGTRQALHSFEPDAVIDRFTKGSLPTGPVRCGACFATRNTFAWPVRIMFVKSIGEGLMQSARPSLHFGWKVLDRRFVGDFLIRQAGE